MNKKKMNPNRVKCYNIQFNIVSLLGLTDPVLIRLDVDSKLSEQLKVGHFCFPSCFLF